MRGEAWTTSLLLVLAIGCTPPVDVVGSRAFADSEATLVFQAPEGQHGEGVAWADADGDGDLDLAVNMVRPGSTAQLWTNDRGQLEATWDSGDDAIRSSAVAWGDMNGDGLPDLAVGPKGDLAHLPDRVFCSLPEGGLSATPCWEAEDNIWTNAMAWGDWDGDQDLDLAIAHPIDGPRVYENDGGVLSTHAVWVIDDGAESTDLAWADADGDGDLDLAVANRNELAWVLINPGGGFTDDQLPVELPLMGTTSVAWGDWDGDGDFDVVLGAVEGETGRVFVNEGGGYSSIATFGVQQETQGVALADLDGDGDIDIVTANRAGRFNTVWFNEGDELDSDSYFGTQDSTSWTVAAGDLDGDGLLEVAVGNSGDYWASQEDQLPVQIYGFDTASLSLGASLGGSGAEAVAFGDIDGDGDLDLAVGGATGITPHRTVVGVPTEASSIEVPAGAVHAVEWVDADHDGRLDLVLGGEGGLVVHSAGELDGAAQQLLTEPITAMAWADVGLDGPLEVAVVPLSSPVLVLAGGATGGVLWEDEGEVAADVAWGDVDGDRIPELAVAAGTTVRIIGFGPTPGVTDRVVVGVPAYAVAWADVDGDGRLDLAIGTATGLLVHLNGEGGLAPDPTWTSEETDPVVALAWGDVDDDGDHDLAVATSAAPDRVYENQGGTLDLQWESPEASSGLDVAWGDLDGDGDQDLVIARGDGPTGVFLNPRKGPALLPNPPPALRLEAPFGPAHRVGLSAGAVPIGTDRLTVPVRLSHPTSDPVSALEVSWSVHGGGAWQRATLIGPASSYATSPAGELHELQWDLATDEVGGDVVVRVRIPSIHPITVSAPWTVASVAVTSNPVRVASGCSLPVDGDGDGFTCAEDCDDDDPAVNPDAVEVCGDFIDDDCDGGGTEAMEDSECWDAQSSSCSQAPAPPLPLSALALILGIGLRARRTRRERAPR